MNHRGRRKRCLLNTGSFSGPIAIFGVALAEYVERVLRKAVRQLVIARFSTAAISQAKRISFTVTRQKASALAIGNTQALRGHLSGQTPVDNVLNHFESVNFVQSENVRRMSRHQNLSMLNLRVTYPGENLTT
ncbi:hypothetical protein KAM260_24200 [Klebsiella pneumoniae]|nr:hypothetical protein KAM260_24200 [Klebsiella pneumoniae]